MCVTHSGGCIHPVWLAGWLKDHLLGPPRTLNNNVITTAGLYPGAKPGKNLNPGLIVSFFNMCECEDQICGGPVPISMGGVNTASGSLCKKIPRGGEGQVLCPGSLARRPRVPPSVAPAQSSLGAPFATRAVCQAWRLSPNQLLLRPALVAHGERKARKADHIRMLLSPPVAMETTPMIPQA